MSAAELRQAAETLRVRAGDPTVPGPWLAVTRPGTGQAWIDMPDVDGHAFGMHGWPFEAQYIATMHPGVGLALADCLEQTATSVDMTEESLHEEVFGLEFALARAINGSAT